MVQEHPQQQPEVRPSARQRREVARRLGWLTEAQAALGWGVILVLAALVGVLYLNQASRIASVGRRVQILQNELTALKRENATLERQIAEAQSIERLQREAIRQGFISAQPEDIEYIIVNEYVSTTAVVPTPTPASSMPNSPDMMSDALWLAFKASINDLIQGQSSEQ